jgi:hypothetical protein
MANAFGVNQKVFGGLSESSEKKLMEKVNKKIKEKNKKLYKSRSESIATRLTIGNEPFSPKSYDKAVSKLKKEGGSAARKLKARFKKAK